MPHPFPHCLRDPLNNMVRVPSQSWSDTCHSRRRHRTQSSVHLLCSRCGHAWFQHLSECRTRLSAKNDGRCRGPFCAGKTKTAPRVYQIQHDVSSYPSLQDLPHYLQCRLARKRQALLRGIIPTDPIKFVWHQIDDAVAFDNAGSTPYLPKQVV